MKTLRFSLFLPVFLLIGGFASAATVLTPSAIRSHNNNGTTPDSTTQNDQNIGLIDSSGLTKVDPSNPATWTHSKNWYDGWQAGRTSATNIGWIVLDFGASTTGFDDLYLWNVKEGTSNANSTSNALLRGVQTFNVWYSTTPTTAIPTTQPANYDFASAGWTQLGTTNTLAMGSTSAVDGIYDLSGILSARYIAIEIVTNYGSITGATAPGDSVNRVGLAEIVVTIPEPSSALLIGVASLGLLRRRRA